MRLFLLATFTFSSLALAGCNTTVKGDTPDVTVKGDGYQVEIGDDKKGDFCPPGQAKKGNC
ncbi:MAG: hypothetical protein ACTHOO_07260 [Alcanivorax sp.]